MPLSRMDLFEGNPLAEVFGYPASDFSEEARSARSNKPCPFNRKTPDCRKDRKDDPLGTCSINRDGEAIITCPTRFTEDWTIAKDAARFFFDPGDDYTILREYQLKDANGEVAGNVDLVLAKLDAGRQVVDFGAVEVQSVYITGNMRDAFEHYMEDPTGRVGFDWSSHLEQTGGYYPSPDWRSSHKRLFRQLVSKGSILNDLGKKQAVTIQRQFYESMPELSEVPSEEADMIWLIYDLIEDEKTGYPKLKRVDSFHTTHDLALEEIEYFETPDTDEPLREALQRKLERESDPPTLSV